MDGRGRHRAARWRPAVNGVIDALAVAAAHPLPLNALDGKVGILGITGSGKTFTAIGLVEILLSLGRQTIIIDPTGAYHGLRTVFPVPIFGGPNGDLQITESDGSAIAQAIIELRLSAIVDVSLLLKDSHASARRFMAGFVARLKNSPQAARYLVMDEADEFMPEHASGDMTRLFGDLKWIVRRGRKDGWRVMMITQRPQDIAKSVLTQCETLIVHQLTSPQDRKAFEEWVKGNADSAEAKIVLNSLARLETGEAWIWSPSHAILERVRIPPNKSADSSKTPEAGDDPFTAANFQPLDIAKIAELIDAPPSESTRSESDVAKAVEAATATYRARVRELERQNAEFEQAQRLMRGQLAGWEAAARGIQELLAEAARGEQSMLRHEFESEPSPDSEEASAAPPSPRSAHPGGAAPSQHRAPASSPSAPRGAVLNSSDVENIAPPKGRALDVLQTLYEFILQHPGASQKGVKEKTWAFLTGTNPKSSTWRGYKAALRPFFEQIGDRVRLLPAGEVLFPNEQLINGSEVEAGEKLVRQFISTVKPAGSAKILETLLAAWPDSVTRANLAAATDVAMSSSTFRGYLAPLNTLELIEKDGQNYRLSRDLMEW